MQKNQEDILQLSKMCVARGLLMKSKAGQFLPLRLAYEPFLISKDSYKGLGELQKVWQKLILSASKDKLLFERTFKQVS